MEAEVLGDLYCQEVLTQSPEDTVDSHGRLSPDYGYNTYNTYSSLHDARNADYLAARPDIQKAHVDPTLLEERVFRNMMDTEDCYIADNNYFENVQSEIKPHMRKIVIDWMLEVCCDQNCHVDVFLLSCNIMDRFLSQVNISKRQFQLVAAATMFIASKLVEPCPVAGSTLVKYTDNTYQVTELLEMELVILARLKWDLAAVTPYSFLEHLLRMMADTEAEAEDRVPERVKKIAETTIILCATEYRFSMYPPSMLSSAALAHSAQEMEKEVGLGPDLDTAELIARLQILTRVENDCLNDCIYQIERTKQANGGGVPSVYEQAVMNQRSEIKTNELPQLPLPNQTKEAPGHQPPLSPESPEKSITPTEVLEVDVLVT